MILLALQLFPHSTRRVDALGYIGARSRPEVVSRLLIPTVVPQIIARHRRRGRLAEYTRPYVSFKSTRHTSTSGMHARLHVIMRYKRDAGRSEKTPIVVSRYQILVRSPRRRSVWENALTHRAPLCNTCLRSPMRCTTIRKSTFIPTGMIERRARLGTRRIMHAFRRSICRVY